MNLYKKIRHYINWYVNRVIKKKYELRKWAGLLYTGKRKTSLSDNGIYPAFCRLAAENDDVFRRFKRSAIYNEILEHADYEDGLRYLEVMSHYPVLLSQNRIQKYRRNDFLGGQDIFLFH